MFVLLCLPLRIDSEIYSPYPEKVITKCIKITK